MILEAIHWRVDEDGGNRRIEYEFSEEASEWEKDAVREYGVESKSEVKAALKWRESVDKLDDDLGRVMRGRDPETEEDVGRGRGRRDGPS